MDTEVRDLILKLVAGVCIIAIIIGGLIWANTKHNTEIHSDDLTITEWVSPDGVHYWYQMAGYHAMLAPRYDSNGNLVIDDKE